jgi:tetratricopeptide (TPR) repeat protein
MSKNTFLCRLRQELDDEITYGKKLKALKIARKGLEEAGAQGLPGESEYFKGELMMLKGNFSQAIKHFDAAISYNHSDGAAYNDRALCMVELGIIDAALSYFDQGIKAESDYANVYHNKGWLLNNIGRHSEAIACFKKALELEPERPVTYDNLADALFNLSDYRGAEEAYKKVLILLKPGASTGIRKQIRARIKLIRQKLNSQTQ